MSKRQTLLERFFVKGERPMVRQQKSLRLPTKRKLQFKRKYQESYLNYGFIATGDSQFLSPLYTICGDRLCNKGMKSSQLLCHMKTKYTVLEDKPLEIFKRERKKKKKRWTWRTEAIIEGHHGKESTCNAGDQGSKCELERSSGEGNGNPLQYSCLENPMDRGARRATVHGVTVHGVTTERPAIAV